MKYLALLVCAVLYSGCATNPKALTKAESGKWDAKVLIKDKVHDRSQVVLAEIIAVRPNSLRIDFHTSLGLSLANFALGESRMSYWVPSKKKYYSGPISSEAFAGLLQTKVDPSWMIHALFEKGLEKEGWVCGKDEAGLLLQCRKESSSAQATSGEFLRFLSREGTRRVVEYEGPSILVKLSLQGQTLNEKYSEKLFVITRP